MTERDVHNQTVIEDQLNALIEHTVFGVRPEDTVIRIGRRRLKRCPNCRTFTRMRRRYCHYCGGKV